MQDTFEVARTARRMLNSYFENYSLEQLNKIPEGFNNSLFWNIAHVVVTQQLLVYKLSGLPMAVSDELVEKYRKGTKPEQDATQEEVDLIKSLVFNTVDQLEADYNNGVFKNYQEYPTSTGFILKSAKGAIDFNNFHEGLHLGVLMSIRKYV
ncbi:DinB family protein [Flavobacterium aquiphilum]|uniref:DinB family protein n=1 Tax=Flavobacterium aquiphilum TaxID=3003261 RepID=UPI0024812C41|nr:DinB family protein [Flavobacterium aquiphilum]